MDVWLTERGSNQGFASSWDLHLRIYLNIFPVHLLYTKQTKKMMKQMPGLMGGGKRKGMKGLGGLGGLMGGKMKLPF